jgi:hypothetical protein
MFFISLLLLPSQDIVSTSAEKASTHSYLQMQVLEKDQRAQELWEGAPGFGLGESNWSSFWLALSSSHE